jgi:hypothetical protein
MTDITPTRFATGDAAAAAWWQRHFRCCHIIPISNFTLSKATWLN